MEQKNEEILVAEIRNLTSIIEKLYKRQSPWHAFSTGIIYSIGYFVGIAFIVGIAAYFLQRVPLIPMIGNWIGEVLKQAMENMTPQQYFQLLK